MDATVAEKWSSLAENSLFKSLIYKMNINYVPIALLMFSSIVQLRSFSGLPCLSRVPFKEEVKMNSSVRGKVIIFG